MMKLLVTLIFTVVFNTAIADTTYLPVNIIKSTSGATPSEFYAQGSGFFINEQGYLATAAHVVEGADNIKVLYRGEMREAKVVSMSVEDDVAILKLKGKYSDTAFFPIAYPQPGQPVFIAGFPSVRTFGLYVHVTNATVMPIFNSDIFHMQGKACQGNSGGAVVDALGNAVGVLVLGFLDQSTEDGVCSEHVGATYLAKLSQLAAEAGVKTYTQNDAKVPNVQIGIYNMVRNILDNEKVVFIQVHGKGD